MTRLSFRLRSRLLLALATIAAFAPLHVRAAGQAAAPAPVAASTPLPVDPAVTIGELPNGLRYYIRHNERPAHRAALRLVVRAGSRYEADDQLGLAHFLEHMAFNGTEHFEPGELVRYFESTGARFGPHVNASTSFDETIYMFEVPTDAGDVVERGLLALSDFADGIRFDPAEIDRERGVVIEEWRGRLGANWRMMTKQVPVLYRGSRYAERLPIGSPEVIRTFPPERLRAFYERWYRPDRMAVIVVGDLPVATAEGLIHKYFSGIPRPETPVVEPPADVPPNEGTLFSVVTDPEAQASTVSVVFKRPAEPQGSHEDYRRGLVRQLASMVLNARFDEISQRPDAPFLNAGAFGGDLGIETDTFELSARVEDGGLVRGLEALVIEARRLRELGFGDAELDRARKWLLAGMEQAYNERTKTESVAFAAEYSRHFLENEPIPGIEVEYRLVNEMLPGITAAEVGEAVRSLITEDNRVVLASMPEKAGLTAPTEADLRAAIDRARSTELTPWDDTISRKSLIDPLPEPGRVTSRRAIPELGVTVLTLSNGVEVWLKPTDFKNDQVLFTSYAPGGTSLAPPEQYVDVSLAPAVIGQSGLGGFTPVELEKMLAGKLAGASPTLSLSTHGVNGSASPRDLETAFQLAHLVFTAPGFTAEGLALLKRNLSAALANQAENPLAVFSDRLRAVNTSNHYTAQRLTPERVAKVELPPMVDYYTARFANAADFTFFIVGAFGEGTIVPLVERYLGSLPSKGERAASFKDVGIRFPETVKTEVVKKGREPRSQTTMTFFADPGNDEVEILRARLAGSVLEVRLRERLREALGGTYGVSVNFSSLLPQPGYGTMTVSFGSSPENADTLRDAVIEEIERLQKEGPTAGETAQVKEQQRRSLETSERENRYWLTSLQQAHLLGRNPLTILRRSELAAAQTPADIQAAAKQYLPLDRYTVVTLMPEDGTTTAGK